MNIKTFNRNIPEKIYIRGEEYYAADLVSEVAYEEPGNWTAEVEGSEDYQVEVKLDGDNIISWDCDCPYDQGDICKHVVAFLLFIRENRNSCSTFSEQKETASKNDDLSDLLKNADKKKIVSFLKMYAEKHPDFLPELEHALLYKKEAIVSVDYKKEIEKCYVVKERELSYNRYGYSNVEEVITDKLHNFLEKAEFFIKKGLFVDALTIALSIMEKVAACYEEYEDYNGYFVTTCNEAETIVEEVIQNCNSEELMTWLIDKLGQLIKNENFENYDLADINGLLFTASLKSSGIDESIKLLDETLKLEAHSFRTASLVITKLELLENAGRLDDVQQEIDKYLYLPEIRKIKLGGLIESKEYEKAILLIDEGIEEAQKKNHPGTVTDWKNTKLKVYQQMGDKEKIISLACDLFLSGRESMAYYHILKSMIPSSQWAVFLDELIAKSKKLIYGSELALIFIEEKYWNRLLDWVLKHTSLSGGHDSASSYVKHLLPHYPEQLLETYRSRVIAYAEHNVGRNHYQFLAEILRKMKTYPKGNKVVSELVADFRKKYANRRAMKEELSEF